jgi:hypothetical protein
MHLELRFRFGLVLISVTVTYEPRSNAAAQRSALSAQRSNPVWLTHPTGDRRHGGSTERRPPLLSGISALQFTLLANHHTAIHKWWSMLFGYLTHLGLSPCPQCNLAFYFY